MKRNFLLSSLFVAGALLLGTQNLYTNSAQPPVGHTGAFGENGGAAEPNCSTAGCHTGTAAQCDAFSVISLNSTGSPSLSTGFAASTQYNLFVNAGNAASYGFSLTAIDPSGNPAGSFSLTSPANTSLQTASNGRQYVGHKVANSTAAWTFRWTSPSTTNDTVLFFLAVNQGNANGASSGDRVFLASYRATGTSFGPYNLCATGVTDIDNVSNMSIFPNPVSDKLNLSFTLEDSKPVKADVYNLNGQLVKPLFNETLSWGEHNRSFNVDGELSTGIYLVKFTVGTAHFFKKVVVE